MSIKEKLVSVTENVPKVYDAGKKARDDEWWDTYLAPMKLGRPTNYLFAGPSWNGNTFYPNQDIIIKENASSMFSRFSWNSNVANIDLAQRLEDCGVTLDVSNATTVTDMFFSAYVTRVPLLNFSKLTSLTEVFNGAKYLQTIDELIIRDDGVNTFSNTFNGCTALKTVKFTGVIGRSINFSDCPLEEDTIKNIAECLKDYSDDTTNHYKYTLTVNSSAFSALEEEGEETEYNGAVCTWAELIDNKKWNLVKA